MGELVGVIAIASRTAVNGREIRSGSLAASATASSAKRADGRVPSVDERGCRQVLRARRVGAAVF
jgi:hypothetical protein